MANKSLTDLTARTATADSDLIHVNSEGTDYKQSKINFVQGGLAVEFATDRLLTSQVDDLPRGSYFGIILSLGHTTETGVPPQNASYYVHAFNYSDAAGIIYLTQMNNGDNYYKRKYQSAWESSWTKEPTRSEITSLNSSLTNSLPPSAIVAITPTGCSNYANYGNSYYYKRGNQVFVHVGVRDLTPNSQTDIFTLPSGHRPLTNYAAVGSGGESYLATSFMSIFSDGTIRITSSDHYAIADGCFTVFS